MHFINFYFFLYEGTKRIFLYPGRLNSTQIDTWMWHQIFMYFNKVKLPAG